MYGFYGFLIIKQNEIFLVGGGEQLDFEILCNIGKNFNRKPWIGKKRCEITKEVLKINKGLRIYGSATPY